MKTHLPHGLRAALMAAIASVSLTTAYGAAPIKSGEYAVDWSTVKLESKGSIKGNNVYEIFCPTLPDQTDYSPSTKASYDGSNTTIGHLNVVRQESLYKTGDIYFDVKNVQQSNGYSISGVDQIVTTTANVYVRIGEATADHTVNYVWNVSSSRELTGNAYMELNDSHASYAKNVAGANQANITGSSTFVIGDGEFNCSVAAGVGLTESGNYTIGNGSYLQIAGGTFNNQVAAGNSNISGSATINGGSHLLIQGGTFNSAVYGGSTGGGTSTINGGVDISINGGTFNADSNVYALGSAGTVNGGVRLTIKNNAKFGGNNIISAGANGSNVKYSGTSSTVTLQSLTNDSSLAKDSSIKVMGGQQCSTLVMQNVIGTINAQLSQFSHMTLSWESDLTLRQDTNATLGDVSSVQINNGSILTLQNNAGQTWDLSGVTLKYTEGVGTLKKTGKGKLTIGDASAFTGTLSVQGGELTLSGATAAKTLTVAEGATLSAKEGNLFTGTGAGSTISVNGATLAANEGNWTLNKKATIDGVTITGTHAVALGSEVDNSAVVTLSGDINATNGNLILKNTAIAAGKTATLSGNITFEGLDNKGNLILKDTAIATATLSGNITIEGLVNNKGTLTLVDGSTINIDEKTLAHNAHFVENGKVTDNGFFADESVRLATGGDYTVGSVNVTLAGEKVEGMALTTKTEGGTNELQVSGFAEKEAKTYFVNKGEVSHSHIQAVAGDMGRTVEKISVEGTLTSDKTETISEALIGSGTLAKSGAGELTVEDSTLFTGAIKASEGTLTLLNSENASVSGLNIQGGATVGVYKNDTATAGEGDSNVGTLTLSSGALVIGADGGTLEADLVINGGTITFVKDATLTMGCSVTIGTSDNTVTIVLDAAEVAVLQGGGTLDIFTDVEGVTLNNANITFTNMDRSETYDDFSLETVETSSGKHTIRATATPEPATATLSLLALAGLAARRKRK